MISKHDATVEYANHELIRLNNLPHELVTAYAISYIISSCLILIDIQTSDVTGAKL